MTRRRLGLWIAIAAALAGLVYLAHEELRLRRIVVEREHRAPREMFDFRDNRPDGEALVELGSTWTYWSGWGTHPPLDDPAWASSLPEARAPLGYGYPISALASPMAPWPPASTPGWRSRRGSAWTALRDSGVSTWEPPSTQGSRSD